MPKLCAFGCAPSGTPMHRFPNADKFPERFKAWVSHLGGKLETASDYEFYQKKLICDIHFTARDRVRNNRLSALAIPSLHLHVSTAKESAVGLLSKPSTSHASKTEQFAEFLLEEEPPLIAAISELSHTTASHQTGTGVVHGSNPSAVPSAVIMEHNYSAASRSFRKRFGKETACCKMADYENHPAVNNLQNYIRIRTVHPNVNYDECINYLKTQATGLGLPCQVYELIPKKPILVMTWEGLEPSLPSILLNSHMDVVPVFEKSWTYPPFEARLVDGVIYGRGVQDMKSVAIQYIEAIRSLKNKGLRFKRTIHLSFVPDEEIGGRTGMAHFVKSDHFKNLNVGFALDEGLASPDDSYLVFNGERSIWHMNVICPGKSGHGSLLLPDNCGEKIRYIIDKFMDLRQESKKKLESDPNLTIGDVTSINLTKLYGGIQRNVVPEKLTASFDLRLALSVDFEQFENMIKQWCKEAGEGVTYEFEQKDEYVAPTSVDDNNQFWTAFKSAFDKLKIPLKVRTFPGGTDSRFIRQRNIGALCISPMRHTSPGLHEHNESLHASVFLEGITVYEEVIPALANV